MSHQQSMQTYVDNYCNTSKLIEKAKKTDRDYKTLKSWFNDNIHLICFATNGHIDSVDSLESSGYTKKDIINIISSNAQVAHMNIKHTLSRR